MTNLIVRSYYQLVEPECTVIITIEMFIKQIAVYIPGSTKKKNDIIFVPLTVYLDRLKSGYCFSSKTKRRRNKTWMFNDGWIFKARDGRL